MYIYPEHLKARAVMWLWQLRDLTVIGVGVFVFCACGGPDWGDYPGAYYGCLCLFDHPVLRIPVSWILSAMPALIFSGSNFLNGG